MGSIVWAQKQDDPEGEETDMVEGQEAGAFLPTSSRRLCRHLGWYLGAWLLVPALPLTAM